MTKRIGRRPGGQPTRREIVNAARDTFAAKGFRGSTIRAIAEAANVDPALIHHYFGNKEQLFAATLEFPEGAPDRLVSALTGPADGLGERLTRAYLQLWEAPATRGQMLIATRAALTDDDAMDRARPMVVAMLGQAAATDVPGPDPEKRFALAMAHLLGVAAVRHLSRVPPLCDLPLEELIASTAPAVQFHLTQN
ncbi:MAG: TetR family transcriptional regulator [Nocardioides sp.]